VLGNNKTINLFKYKNMLKLRTVTLARARMRAHTARRAGRRTRPHLRRKKRLFFCYFSLDEQRKVNPKTKISSKKVYQHAKNKKSKFH
jgi:hypothetical protein